MCRQICTVFPVSCPQRYARHSRSTFGSHPILVRAVHLRDFLPSAHTLPFVFAPSRICGTMTSAAFSTFNCASLHRLDFLIRTAEISADKCIDFHPIYLPHLHHKVRSVSDFALFGKLIRLAYTLYAVSVRQTGILLLTFEMLFNQLCSR